MRIAFISSWRVKCGIAEHTRFLAETLQQLGHEVIILCNYPLDDLPDRESSIEYYPFFYTSWHKERGVDISGALEILQKKKIDIIHWQYQNFLYPDPFLKQILKVALRIPLIVTFHDPLLPREFPRDICEGAVFHCEDTLNLIGWNRPYLIAPIGIHLWEDRPKKLLRNKLKISSRHVLCSLGLGRTDYQKVMQALANLKDKYPDILYIAIGPQPSIENIKKFAEEKGLLQNLIIDNSFPDIEKIKDYLQAADMIVFYYPNFAVEGVCSAAVRLGIAAQRPVIITDVNLMKDLPQKLKITYDKRDELKHRIEELFNNKDLYRQVLTIQKDLINHYNWTNVAEKHVDFYRKFI